MVRFARVIRVVAHEGFVAHEVTGGGGRGGGEGKGDRRQGEREKGVGKGEKRGKRIRY